MAPPPVDGLPVGTIYLNVLTRMTHEHHLGILNTFKLKKTMRLRILKGCHASRLNLEGNQLRYFIGFLADPTGSHADIADDDTALSLGLDSEDFILVENAD